MPNIKMILKKFIELIIGKPGWPGKKEVRLLIDEEEHENLMRLSGEMIHDPEEIYKQTWALGVNEMVKMSAAWPLWETLTPGEQNVLGFTCLGYSNKQIAARLSVREGTVKAHKTSIFQKLGVSNEAEARHLMSGMDFRDWEN